MSSSDRRHKTAIKFLLITSGEITSPSNSSDDEERGRSLGNLRELQEALQHTNAKRASSGDAIPSITTPTLRQPTRKLPGESEPFHDMPESNSDMDSQLRIVLGSSNDEKQKDSVKESPLPPASNMLELDQTDEAEQRRLLNYVEKPKGGGGGYEDDQRNPPPDRF